MLSNLFYSAWVYFKLLLKVLYRSRPICLPLDRSITYENKFATVAGWGVDSGMQETSNVLKFVKVSVMDNNDCQNKWTWIKK